MNITDYFVQRGLKIVPEVTDKRFSMVDDGGCETETGEFLYGFIRRLKPLRVIETGTYSGISAMYMGKALQDNRFGQLWSLEYEQRHIDRSQKLWKQMGVDQVITSIKTDTLKFTPEGKYELMFLDTEMHLRFHELVSYYPYLEEGGYFLVHDMPRSLCQGNFNPDHPDYKHWPVGELPEEFKTLLKERKLMPFYFGGARGMVGFYKVHKEDYI